MSAWSCVVDRTPCRGRDVRRLPEHVLHRQVDRAHREWTPAQIGFLANLVRLYRGEALDFTLGGEEANGKLLEVFCESTAKSLNSQPSTISYRDVPGLCKVATIQDIATQGWSLNPGRYVGVARGEAVSDEDFKEQLETLNEELETLNAQHAGGADGGQGISIFVRPMRKAVLLNLDGGK